MKKWLSKSIGRKLLASFVGIFFLTYFLTAVFVYTSVRASMTQSEVRSLTQLANQKLELVSSELQGVATNLHAWSQLEVMNDLVSGDVDKRVARTLANLKKQYGLAGEIYAFDFQDKLIASSDEHLAAGSISLPPQWVSIGNGVQFIDKHDNPLGSGLGVAMRIVMHASFSPDFNLGVLVVTMPWPAIEKLLAEHSHRILVYKDEIPVLLYAGNDAAPLLADELAMLAVQPADLELGTTRYVAGYSENYHQLFNDWHMAALKEASVAYQPITAVALKLVALGLLLGIPFVLAIRWLSSKLTGPVESLTRVVSGITDSGDLSVRAKIESNDELGTLAMAFNAMAANLQNSSLDRERFVVELEQLNKTLEQRVHDRTEALESANSELTSALDNLKAAQGQLVQSEKMVSLGQLVAGVAHELNNPIGFIYANFPHLEEYANDLFELIEVMRNLQLDEMQKATVEQKIKEVDLEYIKQDILQIIRSGKSGASRIKEIVSSLRSFSRLDEAELKSVLLEDGLDDTLAILNHNIKGRITLNRDYQLNQPVMCLAGQINQVFMNIIYNAIQAMEKEGSLRVVTRAEGPFAVVSIADSGKGIPPEVISKIFDPFFTTKKVGEGTGLGLSISYGIVEKHGGHIEVKSEIGKGTEFTIYIRMRPVQAAPLAEGAS